jgi:hypothetical protein
MSDPLELTYALEALPPGRFPFRRWRWELWQGPQLLAAGWRTGAFHAQRAIRAYALRHAHRRLGVHPLRVEAMAEPDRPWLGRQVAIGAGDVRVLLTPRELLGEGSPHLRAASA